MSESQVFFTPNQIKELEGLLANITGFHSVSVQPNSGAQGEYAGLLCIKRYHEKRGQGHRNVCLIPTSLMVPILLLL